MARAMAEGTASPGQRATALTRRVDAEVVVTVSAAYVAEQNEEGHLLPQAVRTDGESVERVWAWADSRPTATSTRDLSRVPWANWTREELAEARRALATSSGTNDEAVDEDFSESDSEIPPLDPPAETILEAGRRRFRSRALTHDDLYVGGARPPPCTTERSHQLCGICQQVKSHPVL